MVVDFFLIFRCRHNRGKKIKLFFMISQKHACILFLIEYEFSPCGKAIWSRCIAFVRIPYKNVYILTLDTKLHKLLKVGMDDKMKKRF